MRKLFFLIPVLFILSCKQKPAESKSANAAITKDPHSLSEPDKAVVKHLDLDIRVDFAKKQISGKAVWTIENLTKTDEIVFDTRQLTITKVTLGDNEVETMYALGDSVKFLGQPLSVNIEPDTKKVTIYYTTSPQAAALQWLNPNQTAGKKDPFLFTQSEPTLARTWIPVQDSPAIRFTYTAKITVPKNLLALMSAENPQKKSADGVYTFKQEHAIPAYLMALAVGDIGFKAVGENTGVYAEPAVLDKAAWEFADMEKMVTSAEKLYGEYRWGRYDVLVLPPSFPFGGMENPMLTFITPTVIAGDRSLVNVIAHELAHSWSGNLVTNATWNDFWLNEGFTTYFERRIVESIYGKDEKEMQEILGFQDFKDEVADMGETNPDTRLKTDFAGRDADDASTTTVYEKGYAFLRHVEDLAGRDKLDPFLKKYFNSHAFQSMTTEKFLAYMDENLVGKDEALKKKLNVDAWVNQPGIPKDIPLYSSERFNSIDTIIATWQKGKTSLGLGNEIRTTNEALYFIRHLPENLTPGDMASLDKELKFTQSGNAEIECVWYVLAIRHEYKPAYANMERFLTEVGRRKFLMPLYKELVKSPEGKEWAKKIYAKARPNYHSVSYESIDELLK